MSLLDAFASALAGQSLLVPGLAFVGGLVSSLLPCSIAMVPVLLGYVGGYGGKTRAAVLGQTLLFMIGVAAVMTAMGLLASLLGLTFGTLLGSTSYYLIGVLSIVMGLQLLGVFYLPLPSLVKRLPESRYGALLTPLLLGLTFGLASSPCGTPFLAVILGYISQQKNVLLGGASLFCYALGQSVILLLLGLFTGLLKQLPALRQVGAVMNRISGTLFVIGGLLFIAEGAGVLVDLLPFLH